MKTFGHAIGAILSDPMDDAFKIEPDLLLRAYSIGVFPMAESKDEPGVMWIKPEERGIIPLESFHIPRSLAKFLRKNPFDIRVNTAFADVLAACAEETADRPETWINESIEQAYTALHRRGFCHSVEAWRDEELVGGLYGVSLGGAFFGESMFSRTDHASKACLVALVDRMRARGYQLLDTQFTTEHLKRFGAIDIPQAEYEELLAEALTITPSFDD